MTVEGPVPSQRLDKWLWHARFFKTRTLAARVVSEGKVRVDGAPVSKPARQISPGVTLTFSKDDRVRVIHVLGIGDRRGPAPEAQALYDDQSPAPAPVDPAARGANPRFEGGKHGTGRPTKRDRRQMDRFDGLE